MGRSGQCIRQQPVSCGGCPPPSMSLVPGQPGGWSMSIPSRAGTGASYCSQLPAQWEEEMLPQEVGKGRPSAVGGCRATVLHGPHRPETGGSGQAGASGRHLEMQRAGGGWNVPFSCIWFSICVIFSCKCCEDAVWLHASACAPMPACSLVAPLPSPVPPLAVPRL